MSEQGNLLTYLNGENHKTKLRAGMMLFFDGHHLQLVLMEGDGGHTRVLWPLRGKGDDSKTRDISFIHRQQDFAEFVETIAALCGLSIKELKLPPDAPPWQGWEYPCSCLFGELGTENESPSANDQA